MNEKIDILKKALEEIRNHIGVCWAPISGNHNCIELGYEEDSLCYYCIATKALQDCGFIKTFQETHFGGTDDSSNNKSIGKGNF